MSLGGDRQLQYSNIKKCQCTHKHARLETEIFEDCLKVSPENDIVVSDSLELETKTSLPASGDLCPVVHTDIIIKANERRWFRKGFESAELAGEEEGVAGGTLRMPGVSAANEWYMMVE